MTSRSKPKRLQTKNHALNGLEEHITLLPALTLESLLRPEGIIDQASEQDSIISIAQSLAGGNAQIQKKACRRLFPSRNLKDTGVFYDNLSLPILSPRRSQSESPRKVRVAVGAGSPLKSARNVKEWHLTLLQSKDDTNASPEYVAACLTATLGMVLGGARAKAVEATQCSVPLRSFASQTEALNAAELLRAKGLGVRVTSKPFIDASPKARCHRIEQFAEHCCGTLQGDLFRLAKTFEAQQQPETDPRYSMNWRQEAETNLRLQPEDAVEAYFNLDGDDANPDDVSPERRRLYAATISENGERRLNIKVHEESKAEDNTGADHTAAASGGEIAPGGSASTVEPLSPISPPPIQISKQRTKQLTEECRLARKLAFGHVMGKIIDEGDTENKEVLLAAMHQRIGDKSELHLLHYAWLDLDGDGGGRIDFQEFQTYCQRLAKKRKEDANLPRDLQKLLKILFVKKSSFGIGDIMRMIWPLAGHDELKVMNLWLKEFQTMASRRIIHTPPALLAVDLEGLQMIYHTFDKDGDGVVTIDELVQAGIVEAYERELFTRRFDKDGDGVVSCMEFCQMMCPDGMRPTVNSDEGTLPDGRKVVYIENDQIWKLAPAEEEEPLGDDVLE